MIFQVMTLKQPQDFSSDDSQVRGSSNLEWDGLLVVDWELARWNWRTGIGCGVVVVVLLLSFLFCRSVVVTLSAWVQRRIQERPRRQRQQRSDNNNYNDNNDYNDHYDNKR